MKRNRDREEIRKLKLEKKREKRDRKREDMRNANRMKYLVAKALFRVIYCESKCLTGFFYKKFK